MPDTEQPGIQVGQVYRSCDPRDQIRIYVESLSGNGTHAWVVDASTRKRPRKIALKSLHAAAVTETGARRRTGYALDTFMNRSILNA
jgi:hypothetical protein